MRRYATLFWQYLRPQLALASLLAGLVSGSIVLQLVNPQLVRRFLDGAERGRSLDELLKTGAIFMAVAVLAQVLRIAGAYVGENVAWRATNELRADLALHCLKLDMSFHKAHKPGELIERVDGDVNQLTMFFSQLVVELGSDILLSVGVIGLLWLIDWRLGATVLAIAVLAAFGLRAANRHVVPRWQHVRQVESDLFGFLEEWLNGTEEIQTNRASTYVMGRLYDLMRIRWRAMQEAQRVNVSVMSLPLVVPAFAYVAAYLWGERLLGSGELTIGSLFLIFYYIDVVKGPLWGIQRQLQELQRAAASLNRIAALFAETSALESYGQAPLPGGPLCLAFEDVDFYYADDPNTPVLEDIELTLMPGRVLGLLGRTGSGKTTMTRLLSRFYDPTSGQIRLGAPCGEMTALPRVALASLRGRIGMVTQDVQLFHASVRDNLTLFADHVTDERIKSALQELGLKTWLDALPDGLDTRLEGGANLSAGEAQLLALGRVFLADVGLVILDEASSRLDPATEHLLERALDRLLEGRTAIIIAHRLSTVRRADEIMILERGRIVEHGDRETLALDPNSTFHHLLQVGIEEALA
ncbi:MAG TPA: ABC transporter ATP-binding protein [Candidatus Binatia bacterium]|nr:ABC transporter ATP-binding protein [Candidatus Binatia bacterium]